MIAAACGKTKTSSQAFFYFHPLNPFLLFFYEIGPRSFLPLSSKPNSLAALSGPTNPPRPLSFILLFVTVSRLLLRERGSRRVSGFEQQ